MLAYACSTQSIEAQFIENEEYGERREGMAKNSNTSAKWFESDENSAWMYISFLFSWCSHHIDIIVLTVLLFFLTYLTDITHTL